MRKFLLGIGVIGPLGVVGLVGLVGLAGAGNLLASEKVAALVEAELAKDGIGSISLGIIQGSELVYEAAFGYADMEKEIEATPQHVYRIGSITKQLTALALLKMSQDGTVRLSDPVASHFPEVKRVRDRYPGAPPITLVQLATMTSGLAREPEDLPSYLVGPASEWVDVVLRALPAVKYDFAPDTRYQYSNIGYAILGVALERASGRDYMDYVRKELLEPLGMKDSDFVPRPHFEARVAIGYALGDGEIDAETPAREHAGRGYKVPNGALYSTVSDLARFISFQLGHGPDAVLPSDVLADNFKRVSSADGDLSAGYGIGFRVVRRGERIVFGHGGSVAGYRAGAYFDRESGRGVVLLRNVTGDHVNVTELAMRILELPP